MSASFTDPETTLKLAAIDDSPRLLMRLFRTTMRGAELFRCFSLKLSPDTNSP